MEQGGQKRQIVAAAAIAVVAGLALAASVYYMVGPDQTASSTTSAGGPVAMLVGTTTVVRTTTVTNTVVGGGASSLDCFNVSGRPLYLGDHPIQLAADGTSSINGTEYWYATFVPTWNGTDQATILFQGVSFTMTAPDSMAEMKVGQSWSMTNTTFLVTLTQGAGHCGYELPPIKVSFGDGSSANYNTETVAVGANGGTINFDKPSSNPWLTQHTSPQAGVGYQTDGGQITLYVSR